jgi:hypothetical protein
VVPNPEHIRKSLQWRAFRPNNRGKEQAVTGTKQGNKQGEYQGKNATSCHPKRNSPVNSNGLVQPPSGAYLRIWKSGG